MTKATFEGKYSKKQSSSNNSSMTRGRFPTILHRLLEDAHDDPQTLGKIISWEPCGTGFRILDQRLFTALIMPRYFASMTHFKSFRRQLNLYGIKQVSLSRRRGHNSSLEAATKVVPTMGLPSTKEGILLDNQSPIQKGGVYHHPLFQRGNPDLAAILPRINGNQNKGSLPRIKGSKKETCTPSDLQGATSTTVDVSEHSNHHRNEQLSWSSLFVSEDSTSNISPSPMKLSNNDPKRQYIESGAELRGDTPHLISPFLPCIMGGQDSNPQLELPFETQIADIAIPMPGRITEFGRSSPMTNLKCFAVTLTCETSTMEGSSSRSVEVDTPSWLLWEPSPMRFSSGIHAPDEKPQTFDEGTPNDPFHSKEDLHREIIKTFLEPT